MTKDIKWAIDQSHSEITFKVKHLMIAHSKGAFKTFDANIYTTGKDFETAEIDLWIDPTSIITGDAKRDTHLKGSDFFDVENHKQITFKSSTIGKKDANGNHELWGELTIKGITKPVKLDVQFGGVLNDPWGHEKAGFTVTGTIKRSDWGLVWNAAIETGGVMVSEEVTISCDIELTNVNQKELAMELEPSTGKKIGF
ncbi:MAG TPA: YceI family protein [Bacteroidia bacterium]|jgi:polyisoprenoid-binding protein YceI|nr:YceI family protein [Bacteroidia bacterium]